MQSPMRLRYCSAISIFCLVSNPAIQTIDEQKTLATLATDLCLNHDGDHRATWQRATESGYSESPEPEIRSLSLVGNFATHLRGFQRRTRGGMERVLTSSLWIRGPDDGTSYFRICWVSSTSANLRDVTRQLRQELGGNYFRAEKTLVYAWIPRPDGTNEFVPRRIFMRRNLTLAREQGMRQVMVRQYGEGVFVSYLSPRDEATYRYFDWSGPPPVSRPE